MSQKLFLINSTMLFIFLGNQYHQEKGFDQVPMYKQVCVIPFRREYLLKFNNMLKLNPERIESIDMNRIIESGEKIRMVEINETVFSVDTLSDLRKVEAHLENDFFTH